MAIHNHLIGEKPRVLYVHFHGHGDPLTLAKTLSAGIQKTATPPPGQAPLAPTPEQEKIFERLQQALGRKGTIAGVVLQVGFPERPPFATLTRRFLRVWA
jgi:hypothetical protein